MNGKLTRKLPKHFSESLLFTRTTATKGVLNSSKSRTTNGFMCDISRDYFGCLLNKTLKISWEGYHGSPAASSMGEINCELVHLFVKFAVRIYPI